MHAQVLAERQQLPVQIFRGESCRLQRIAAQKGQELIHVRFAALVVVGNLFLPTEQHVRGVGEHHQQRSRDIVRIDLVTGEQQLVRSREWIGRGLREQLVPNRKTIPTVAMRDAARAAQDAQVIQRRRRQAKARQAEGDVAESSRQRLRAGGRGQVHALPVVEGKCEVVAVDHAFHEVRRADGGHRRHAHDVQLRANGHRVAMAIGQRRIERI